MSHCSLCGAGRPGTQRSGQTEISVCKPCSNAVIELSSHIHRRGANKTPPLLRRYRRRSIFSRLWAFS